MKKLFLQSSLFCIFLMMIVLFHTKPVVAMDVSRLSPPKSLPTFELKGVGNKKINREQFQHHWSLLFFGFTQCQMICPATMATIKEAYSQIEKEKKVPPEVVFISVDSKHDTPEKVDRYAKSFNENFIGLSGKSSQIIALTQALGVLFMEVEQQGHKTIDHSANLFLINPQGQVVAIFSPTYESKPLAKAIIKVQYAK